MRFVLFTRRGCHLCEQAEDLLAVHRLEVVLVDVDADDAARARYGLRVPVLELDGEVVAEGRIDDRAVAPLAAAFRDRG